MSRDTNDPMPDLMSPLSSNEIASLLGGIREAGGELGAGIESTSTAVKATVTGLRNWCGDPEITLALMSLTGLQPRPAVAAFD